MGHEEACQILRQGESQMRALGATACTAHPKVLRNIARQLEEHNIVTTQELQIARHLGLLPTIPVARAGFNDGIVLPYECSAGASSLKPLSSEAPLEPVEPKKRHMHAIALLVDFSDNRGTRSAKDFEKVLFDKAN